MEKENLIKFIEAVEANQDHAAFLLGLRRNAALQYHATNVTLVRSMDNAAYLESVKELYPGPFAKIEHVADQCASLAEALGKDANTLQAVDLFRSVVDLAKGAQPQPVAEEAQPVTEADGSMMAKCPKCGNEFSVKMPYKEAEKPDEKPEA